MCPFGIMQQHCCMMVVYVIMDLDRLFHALADSTRRRLIDELAERDGQTLFELHVRMMQWHGAGLTRQALSRTPRGPGGGGIAAL